MLINIVSNFSFVILIVSMIIMITIFMGPHYFRRTTPSHRSFLSFVVVMLGLVFMNVHYVIIPVAHNKLSVFSESGCYIDQTPIYSHKTLYDEHYNIIEETELTLESCVNNSAFEMSEEEKRNLFFKSLKEYHLG